MADYPTTKLKKALARRGDSSADKTAWQELMERHDTVPATEALQAPDVIKGFSGSWAASYELGDAIRNTQQGESPAPVQLRANRLGQPGMAEINFRPYDHGTTRHGKYGPSLVGHPISFEVIGPTLKNRECIHQWTVTEVGGADVLTLDSTTALSAPAGGGDVPLPVDQNTLVEIYGISAMPDEGMYLFVSMTGAEGTITGGLGGVGDGLIGTTVVALVPPREPIVPTTEDSKYEIFRVVALTTTSVTLDTSKRLEDYFTFNPVTGLPLIRAITLIKPAATRLVAVPGSGARGAEKVFAFVPPKLALNDDMRPIYTSWTTDGEFDPWVSGPSMATHTAAGEVGEIADYSQAVALPVPNPVAKGFGRLQGINGEAPEILSTGRMRIVSDILDASFHLTANTGKILRIFDVRRVDSGTWATATTEAAPYEGDATEDRLLGYFEILDAGASWGGGAIVENYYDVRMVSQFDPATGVPFYFSGDLTRMATGSAAGATVDLQWTLHESIETLWTDTYLNPAKLDAARLKNLIDPRWARPSLKARSGAAFGHPSLPDRAAFDTSSSNGGAPTSNANPGSLMDLGFRAVLYPARVDGADLVPDFDNPIDCNEVVIDPTSADAKQFIEVDYSAGLVALSHAATAGGQLLRSAAVLTNAANPRGEMVLFASCVPFSREPGQMGANPRVTGGISPANDNNSCLDPEQTDAFGGRIYWPAATQTLTSGPQLTIELDEKLSPLDIPLTGFVDIVIGATPAGAPTFTNAVEDRHCTFGYTQVDYEDAGHGGDTTLVGTFGGGTPATTYGIVPGITPATVVLRKNIVIPNVLDGTAGTDYRFDTTYGFAKRAAALRFKNGTLTPEADGSVTVDTTSPKTEAHEDLFGELISSWCINGGVMSTSPLGAGADLDFTACTVLINGVRSVVPAQAVTVSLTDIYVYIDGTTPTCPSYATTTVLDLPNSNDVLIGRYTVVGPNVTAFVDLRQPLVDLDKRLDVTVGRYSGGHAQPGTAHFNELADAIQFVAETMDPVGVGGAGVMGQFRRIKVIGWTAESESKLPIAFPVSGLIIEGAAWPQDGTIGAQRGITWIEDSPALFDLSGCSGWIFRDLVFAYEVGGGSATDATVTNRTLCTVMDGSAEDILFENVLLQGGAHGFLYMDDATTPGSTDYDSVTLRNCIASDITDFAVLVNSNVGVSSNLRVENCHFEVEKGGSRQTALTNTGNIHVGPGTADDTFISDTTLKGGQVGIAVFGDRMWIENCNLSDTDTAGIWLSQPDFGAVKSCVLDAVHTLVGTSGPATPLKVGVWMYRPDQVSVLNNRVSLSGGVTSDQAIHLETQAGQANIITGNEVDWDIDAQGEVVIRDNNVTLGSILVTGDNAVVAGNDCKLGLVVVGGSNRIDHNYTSDGNLDITGNDNICSAFVADGSASSIAGDDNHLVSSRTAYPVTINGDRNRAIGNDLGTIYLNGARMIVKGNTFSGSILSGDTLGTAVSASTISDNDVVGDIQFDEGSDDNIVSNNRVVGDIITAAAILEPILEVRVGDNPQILGNQVGGDIVCALYDADATSLLGAGSDDPMIHNNRVGGNIICSTWNGVAVYYACATPSVQGNYCDTGTSTITVGAGYIVIGNRAKFIDRVVGLGAADPDAAGVVMGNKIVSTIFNVATAASGWDTNVDDNAVSGGDTSTGFIKVGNTT